MIEGTGLDLSRRDFVVVGFMSLSGLSGDTTPQLAQQQESPIVGDPDYQSVPILKGQQSARPDPDELFEDVAFGGYVYWGVDNGGVVLNEITRGDSKWTLLSIGSSSNPVPSVTTDVLNNVAHISGGGDETDLQAAVDEVDPTANRQQEVVVEGRYELGGPVNVDSFTYLNIVNAELVGTGAIPSNSWMVQTAADSEQVTILGGFFDGDKANHSTAFGGLNLRATTDGVVQDSRHLVIGTMFYDIPGRGFRNAARRSGVYHSQANQCFKEGYVADATDIDYIMTVARKCASGGAANADASFVVNNAYCHFYNCWAAQSFTKGVFIDTSNTRWVGGGIENNQDFGVREENGSENTQIAHCNIINNATMGVETAGNRSSYSFNEFRNNAGVQGDQSTGITVGIAANDVGLWGNVFDGLTTDIDDKGERTVVNGRFFTPPIVSLGGSAGSIGATDKHKLPVYHVKVDPGSSDGSNPNLEGCHTILQDGIELVVKYTAENDSDSVVVQHNASPSAGDPFLLNGGTNQTLSTDGETMVFEYDARRSAFVQSSIDPV